MLVAVYLIGVVCLATPHQGTHTVHTNHHAFGKMWAPGHKKKECSRFDIYYEFTKNLLSRKPMHGYATSSPYTLCWTLHC